MDTAISPERDPVTGYFLHGNSIRRQKRQRIEAMMRDIASEFDGGLDALKPSDRISLEKACSLLCGCPQRHDVEVRAINSANRLLSGLRKRLKPEPDRRMLRLPPARKA